MRFVFVCRFLHLDSSVMSQSWFSRVKWSLMLKRTLIRAAFRLHDVVCCCWELCRRLLLAGIRDLPLVSEGPDQETNFDHSPENVT